jgi:hypothetical protein
MRPGCFPPLEPTTPGTPIGWTRRLNGGVNTYIFSVDNVVKHSDKASASIKFACGERSIELAWSSNSLAASYSLVASAKFNV